MDWYGSLNFITAVNEKYELFIAIMDHCIEQFVLEKNIRHQIQRSAAPNFVTVAIGSLGHCQEQWPRH